MSVERGLLFTEKTTFEIPTFEDAFAEIVTIVFRLTVLPFSGFVIATLSPDCGVGVGVSVGVGVAVGPGVEVGVGVKVGVGVATMFSNPPSPFGLPNPLGPSYPVSAVHMIVAHEPFDPEIIS